jgi:hypothetical protein
MSYRFIIPVLCLLTNLCFANKESDYTTDPQIQGKILERRLLPNGDWNLFVEVISEDEKTAGWVYYNPESDYTNWSFYDSDYDLTKNMELAENFNIRNSKLNSNLLKSTPENIKYKIVKPLSEEDDFQKTIEPENTKQEKAHKGEKRKSLYPIIPDHKNWSAQCNNFIDSQGNINSWGQTVINAVNRYPEYLNSITQDMQKYCPNFSSFNKSEKENFWVWFIASMAMRESSCNPDTKAKGPNGTAAGLLQLHLNKEYAYHKDCKSTHALNPHENLSCGSAMFDTQLIRYNRMFLAHGSYWEVLQTDNSGNGVRKLLALYRPCH